MTRGGKFTTIAYRLAHGESPNRLVEVTLDSCYNVGEHSYFPVSILPCT